MRVWPSGVPRSKFKEQSRTFPVEVLTLNCVGWDCPAFQSNQRSPVPPASCRRTTCT